MGLGWLMKTLGTFGSDRLIFYNTPFILVSPSTQFLCSAVCILDNLLEIWTRFYSFFLTILCSAT